MSRDGGYDDWLDALADGEGYYLECANGHGWIPPRRACPDCGSTELTERDLPAGGRVETFTVVHVGTPDFDAQTPYVTAIAAFGDVSLTGLVRDVDPEEMATGTTVGVGVGTNPTTGGRVVVFRPQ